jgi:hypothetical protein
VVGAKDESREQAMTLLSYLDAALLMALLTTTATRYIKVICNPQVLAIVVGALVPAIIIGDLPVYQYLRAVLGDLSIGTKLLLLVMLYQRGAQRIIISESERSKGMWVVAITGLIFYPLSLGLSMFDPYAFGYSASGLVAIALILAAVCAWRRLWWLALALSLSVIAHLAGILESDNFWDYLVDPLLWLYALFVSCATLLKKYRPALKRTGA